MNATINGALTTAAEKVLQRPLGTHEALHLLAGFYAGDEGTLRERVLGALAEGINVPRPALEAAAAGHAGTPSISDEIARIQAAWLAAA